MSSWIGDRFSFLKTFSTSAGGLTQLLERTIEAWMKSAIKLTQHTWQLASSSKQSSSYQAQSGRPQITWYRSERFKIGGSCQISSSTVHVHANGCLFWPLRFYMVSVCFVGASLSEPHTDVLTWDSVTRDIYRYRRTDRYLWAGAFSPALYFFWPDLVDRKLHTEPHITRIPMHNTRLRSRAYCAHTDARPAYLQPAKSTWRPVGSGFFSVSDSIDFNFKKILNSPECQRCRKVHIDIDACSRKARLSSAKYMISSQIGFLDALTLWTCAGSDMTAYQYQCSSMLCQGSMYVYMYMGYWSSSVRLRRANSQDAHACVRYRYCGSAGSTINVSEVTNLRKLAQARPTMPCIPLVILNSARVGSLILCW